MGEFTMKADPKSKCDRRGRPFLSDRTKLKNRPVSIVLSQEIYAKLESLAKERRLPEATVARLLIEEGVMGLPSC